MIDVDTPQGRLFKRLGVALHDRRVGRYGRHRWSRDRMEPNKARPPLELLDAYFRGDPPLQQVATEWQNYVREFMRMARLNIADLLVGSTSNRMQLRDFRTAAADDEMGDLEARNIMRANEMGLKFRDIHDGMLSLGDGYGIATPPGRGEKFPLVTVESALEAITGHDPATGRGIAGLKMFRDDWDGDDWAYLHVPGKVFVARKRGSTTMTTSGWRLNPKAWEWVDDKEQNVPDGRLAIVRYRNRLGVGEFENHLGSLDRINDKIANEWWIGKIQAFRQRAVKLPDEETDELEDDEKGPEPKWEDVFVADPGAMWQVPAGTDFWESQPVDLTPITNAIKQDLERLAAVTQTMLHTITPDRASGSAEGASLMREEHTFKVEDRRERVNGAHAELMSLCFTFANMSERAKREAIEPIWGPVERYSLQEKSNAASQLKGNLPQEAIWTDVLQYPPAEVPNLRTLRGRDLLFQPPGEPARTT